MGLIKSSRSFSEVQEWSRIEPALNYSLYSNAAGLLGRVVKSQQGNQHNFFCKQTTVLSFSLIVRAQETVSKYGSDLRQNHKENEVLLYRPHFFSFVTVCFLNGPPTPTLR